MQLTPVEEIPIRKANCQYKNLKEYLGSYMKSNVRCVHVGFTADEFANVYSAYGSFRRMIRLLDYPIEPAIINSELYLTRTDMEEYI